MAARRRKKTTRRKASRTSAQRKATRRKATRKSAARKKKATRKKTTRRKATRKKTTRKKAATRVPAADPSRALRGAAAKKLDPCLALVATRAGLEGKADLRPVRASVSRAPAGLRGMAAQVSRKGRDRLVNRNLVSVLVDTDRPEALAEKCRAWKGEAHALSGSTVLLRAPRERLLELAGQRGVKYVEASTRLRKMNDLAQVAANLRTRPAVSTRTVSETGRGVLVGVIDTGIDAGHRAFRRGNRSRIVDYLDQEAGVHHRAGSNGAISISRAVSRSPDTDGHGTHVAGIAAGNGAGSPNRIFQGCAPEADLAIVKTTFDTGDIALGVSHLFELAERRQQPCVVNLSLGGHFGAHDGTSVIERTIDQLCEPPGRVVVVSAGNEGGSATHAGTRIEEGQRWVADVELTPREIERSFLGQLVVQVWTQWEDRLDVRLRSPNGQSFRAPRSGSRQFDRSKFLVVATGQDAPYSGDHSTSFEIVTVPEPEFLRGWSVIVEDRPRGGARVGAVHAWIPNEEMGRFNRGFTRSHLVGMPATAFSAVTVGSYATRKEWRSQDPEEPEIELDAMRLADVSYFSSPGPTREGHNKPEIGAPGQWLISALSSQASTDAMPRWLRAANAPYAALQGTSMAAPFVSGAIALLFEKSPRLHWAEVKRRLIKSATSDEFTTPVWNERWGYGKIDVRWLLTVEPS